MLSRLAFAKLIKIAASAWRYIELGRSAPQLGTLILCGKELGFDVLLLSGRHCYILSEGKDGSIEAKEETREGRMHLLDKLASKLEPEELPLVCELIQAVISSRAARAQSPAAETKKRR